MDIEKLTGTDNIWKIVTHFTLLNIIPPKLKKEWDGEWELIFDISI